MRGIKPFKLGFLTRPFEWAKQHRLGVSVLAMFPFDSPGDLVTDMEMWELVGRELEGQTIDVGIPKSRSEYLVWGHCYQPDGQSVNTSPITVRVGDLEKTLYVVGDRLWEDGIPSAPLPFSEMPI